MVVGYGAVTWSIDDGNEQSIPDIVILVCSAVGYDDVGAKQARPCVDDPASVTFGGGDEDPVQEVVPVAGDRAQSLCIKAHLLLGRGLIVSHAQPSQHDASALSWADRSVHVNTSRKRKSTWMDGITIECIHGSRRCSASEDHDDSASVPWWWPNSRSHELSLASPPAQKFGITLHTVF